MVLKTITMFTVYLAPFFIILFLQPPFWLSMILWGIMGLAIAGIGMSVMHDANHEAYSENKTVNFWLGHSLNLLGGSVPNWKMQHNIRHHTYTNIAGMDDDIKDRFALRLSPHTKVKGIQKGQYLYAFFLYGLATLFWVLFKDFEQYIIYTRIKVTRNTDAENRKMLFKIILLKVIYLIAIFGIPMYVANIPFLQVLSGFLLMHFMAGLVLTTIFQLAHTIEGTTHPLPDENGNIENNWAVHQMHTTANFCRGNKFLCWYLGGLNFQVEHHLFPTICHVHYPEIAPIVKQTAEEFGVPYLENETFAKAISAHIGALKKFGRPSLSEAIAG